MAELAGIAGCPDGDDGSDCDIGTMMTMTTVDALRRTTFGTRGICLFPRLACPLVGLSLAFVFVEMGASELRSGRSPFSQQWNEYPYFIFSF